MLNQKVPQETKYENHDNDDDNDDEDDVDDDDDNVVIDDIYNIFHVDKQNSCLMTKGP